MKLFSYLVLLLIILFASCRNNEKNSYNKYSDDKFIIDTGSTVQTRFAAPAGFSVDSYSANSFGNYLQHLPLKPNNSKVYYYNGNIKRNNVYSAVVNISTGTENLQQCADAVMRLRAEYLYKQKQYDSISFNLTNGFRMPFAIWRMGNSIQIKNNTVSWVAYQKNNTSYASFQQYLRHVFSYAGTLSLSKQLKPKNIQDIQAGDVFIEGGSPGHAVILVQTASNKYGEKVFLLAQSYMPAQDIHILKNYKNSALSPWYELPDANSTILQTPEWKFKTSDLKTW